jgi:hypothetical protein
MDDLTLLRSFRAEQADGDPRPRAAAWRALEAQFDPPSATSPASPPRSRRSGVLALAGAGIIAAIVGGILILSSGSSAEPAAAEVLRRIATVAEGTPSEPRPGPGEFLYGRTRTLELESWFPDGRQVSHGGQIKAAAAFTALVPTDHEFWMSPEGAGRSRETMGAPRFLSSAEQDRWEQAGSPLPGAFDPSGQDTALGTHVDVLEARRGVIDIELPKPPEGRGPGPNFGFPDTSGLPTEPEALRLAIQNHPLPGTGNRPGGKPLDTEETILGLWGILQQPVIAPELRAAVFNALAELPGIELDRDATDLVGRPGYAISFFDQASGLRGEYIFDPDTSAILGERIVLADPGRSSSNEGLPAGLTIRENAYLQAGVVDSTTETTGNSR